MLLVIEGIDGSGKQTQTDMLARRAQAAGYTVATFSFPRYGTNIFSRAISEYLRGAFGNLSEIPPQFPALLYAGDRFSAKDSLAKALQTCDLVICDRYVPSNMAHQAAKLNSSEQQAFVEWISDLEYGAYGMPRPSLSALLDVPVPNAQRLIRARDLSSSSPTGTDIHERDFGYLVKVSEAYDMLTKVDRSTTWLRIRCIDEAGNMLDRNDINEQIWESVSRTIGKRSAGG